MKHYVTCFGVIYCKEPPDRLSKGKIIEDPPVGWASRQSAIVLDVTLDSGDLITAHCCACYKTHLPVVQKPPKATLTAFLE